MALRFLPGLPSCDRSLLSLIVALISLAVVAYWNAFNGAFQFDDYLVIVDNPNVHSGAAWLHSMPGIRPLLKLSYTWSWVSGEGTTAQFHLFNLFCHIFNSLMVMALLRTWPGLPIRAAGVGAILFALHPMQTEAVTYICGRSVSLMASFYLAAALAFIYGETKASYWRRFVSPLLFLAALATKETAWTLPFALLLWESLRSQKSWRELIHDLWPLWIILLLACAYFMLNNAYRHLVTVSLGSRDPVTNVLTQVSGQFYLVRQLIWPFHSSIDPDLQPIDRLNMTVLLQGLVLGLLGWWSIRQRQYQPWLMVGLLWFFLHLLPTNSFLPRLDVANDRQLYLASIGPCLMLAIGWTHLHCKKTHRKTAWLLFVIAVLVYGSGTILRNLDYRSEIALWEATVQESPGQARAWLNLGYAYRLDGRYADARSAYEMALRIRPGYEKAQINLNLLPPS